MQELSNFFNQGWVGSLIGFVGIILGALGIFSYKISKSIAKPSYQKASLRLLGKDENNLPSEVTILFNGMEVNRLTKTTIILWNNGTEVLDGKDVIPADPIQISLSNGDSILSYKLLKQTKEVNNFRLVKNEKLPHQLLANFDYFDPNDGVVLEILHDSKERYPAITGTIKGLPCGFVDLGRIYTNNNYKSKGIIGVTLRYSKIIYGFAIFIGLSMAVFGLIPQEIRELIAVNLNMMDGCKPIASRSIAFVVFGFLYALMPALLLWYRRKRYPKILEIDENES